MSFSFKGLKQALWGGAGEPTVVEVGAGLLEMMIYEPSKAKEAGAWLQQHHRDRFMIWNLLQVRSRSRACDQSATWACSRAKTCECQTCSWGKQSNF